jgi:hypothetical protein
MEGTKRNDRPSRRFKLEHPIRWSEIFQKRRAVMKKIKIRDKKFRSTGGKIMIGLVMASMIGGLSALPAFGQEHRRPAQHDRERYERRDRDRDAYYHRRVYREHDFGRPVYAPPTIVIEPPPPPPGINIFLPRIFIR